MISNRLMLSVSTLALGLLGSCSALPAGITAPPQYGQTSYERAGGGSRVTGIIGVTEVTTMGVDLNSSIGRTQEDADATMPLIAAQVQVPLRRNRFEFGYEGGFSLGWNSERDAYVIDTGVVLVTADNKALLFDISGGLYVAKMLGQRFRLYGGAGPLFQFARVDLDLDQQINGKGSIDGSGVGLGYYARTGLEVITSPGTSVGISLRWVDSSADLGNQIGDFDIQAFQIGLAVTSGF